jgi:formylglycine-generating enzyme required for sulfatase activity
MKSVIGFGLVLLVADVHGHRPPPADRWWSGLGPASTEVPASGVQLLAAPARGRVRIPAGTFVMGATEAQKAHAFTLCRREVRTNECDQRGFITLVHAEGSAHPVTLSSFEMDRTEVTVRDYERCVSAGVCAPA